ncbi:MAG: tRNA(Ile)-lysidine synthetase, partial [Rhodobacteraceae bacterium]|nr:tRNA(Ile)-lysidine synthetase [Paracoccaceae bacterium]
QTGNTLFLRPFLGVSRTELRAFLTRRQQTWCDDPDNTNDRFDRIKARRALTHLEPLGVGSQALAKVAAHMQTADTALRYYTGQAMQDLVDIRFGALRIDAKGFADLPMEIARRFTASAIQWCTNSTYPPRRAALARFITALGVGQTGTLGGCIGLVDRDAIWVGREPGAVQDVQCGADECWDGRWSVTGTAPAGSRLRAAGDRGLSAFPGWRNLGVPRRIMLATPAVWMGDAPIALPAAQEPDGWRAQLVRGRDDCAASLLSH